MKISVKAKQKIFHRPLRFFTIFLSCLKEKEWNFTPFFKAGWDGRQALFRHLYMNIFKFSADSPIICHFINS